MSFQNLVQRRYSARQYSDKPVLETAIDQIIAIGGNAPVGQHNYQSLHFTVITEPTLLQEIRDFGRNEHREPTYNCPCLILVSSNRYPDPFAYQDAACAIDHMCLAATDMGIDNVYLYGFLRDMKDYQPIVKKLNLPEGYVIIAGVGLGYSNQAHAPKAALTSQVCVNKILDGCASK